VEAVPLDNELLPNPKGLLAWHNLFPDTDFEIHTTGDKLHEEIKVGPIARAAVLGGSYPYPAEDTALVLVYQVDWGQVPGLADDDGDIDYDSDFERTAKLYLKNHQGQIITALPASKAWAEGDEETQVPLRKRFVKVGGQHYLLVGAPVLALNALPQGTIVFDPDIDEVVAASLDDAWEAGNGAFDPLDDYYFLTSQTDTGSEWYKCSGARFSVDIAQGATITAAYCELYIFTASEDDANLKIYANAVDNAQNFDAGPTGDPHVISRARTDGTGVSGDGYVSWVADGVGTGYQGSDIDLTNVVQEIVNRGGWSATNYLMILHIANSDRNYVSLYGYQEDKGVNPNKLHIEFTEGGEDVPVSLTLSRVATVTASGQAATLAAASLARLAGLTDAGQAVSLAATTLARLDGIMQSASAATLAAILTEIFKALTVTPLAADYAASFTLARTAGADFVAFLVPGERMYIVLIEDRVYVIPVESRIYTVPAEDRIYTVPKG
jgi:hypothetical protein